ncbi:hypothetical protein HDV03_003214 [Kappamyces sp. JEL0829]|nr:hypothetical protein HDV03_003214 [Kappamyces sp. JEL0829]
MPRSIRCVSNVSQEEPAALQRDSTSLPPVYAPTAIDESRTGVFHKETRIVGLTEPLDWSAVEQYQNLARYTVHGPRPANKTLDIPRKVYEHGIRASLAAKFFQDQLFVVDKLHLERPDKTLLKTHLDRLGLEGKKVYFMYGANEPSYPLVTACDMFTKKPKDQHKTPNGEKPLLISPVRHVNVFALMEYDYLILDKEAVEGLEELYRLE